MTKKRTKKKSVRKPAKNQSRNYDAVLLILAALGVIGLILPVFLL